MTLRTVGAKAALMFIFVADRATGRETEPGVVLVFAMQQRTRIGGNILRRVTAPAGHANVLPLQMEASL